MEMTEEQIKELQKIYDENFNFSKYTDDDVSEEEEGALEAIIDTLIETTGNVDELIEVLEESEDEE